MCVAPRCRDSNSSGAARVKPEEEDVLRNTPGRGSRQVTGLPAVSAHCSLTVQWKGVGRLVSSVGLKKKKKEG